MPDNSTTIAHDAREGNTNRTKPAARLNIERLKRDIHAAGGDIARAVLDAHAGSYREHSGTATARAWWRSDERPSLDVLLTPKSGKPAGSWIDRAMNEGGDVLDLVAKSAGLDAKRQFIDVLKAAAGLGGIDLNRYETDAPARTGSSNKASAKIAPLDELATVRGWTVDALKALGAQGHNELEFNGKKFRRVVSFPQRRADGSEVSVKIRRSDGKAFGSKKALQQVGDGTTGLAFTHPLPAAGDVLLCEGEADACALLSADASGVVALPSCSPGKHVLDDLQKLLTGRRVVYFYDAGLGGATALLHVGRVLVAAGVHLLFVPPQKDAADIDEALKKHPAAERPAVLQKLMAGALPWSLDAAENVVSMAQREKGRVAKREVVDLLEDHSLMLSQAHRLLVGHPDLFQRDGRLVVIDRPAGGAPRIAEVDHLRVARLLSDGAVFEKYDARSGGMKPTRCPDWLARLVVAENPPADVRTLRGIATAPTLRPDGSILQAPGYDEATRLFLLPHDFPPMPENPTPIQARQALDELLEVVENFPFAGDAHRSAWLALVLTLASRAAIEGNVPAVLFDATTRRTGKTLLAEVAAMIATGARNVSRSTFPSSEAEGDKRVTAILHAGAPFCLFDNLPQEMEAAGGWLDAAITSQVYEGRDLGHTRMLRPENNTVFAVTGNNLRIGGDLSGRSILIRLETDMEHPEARPTNSFRHPRLKQWVRENHKRLHMAALTVLRAYISAGLPPQDLPAFGGFEEWSDLVRSAIVWLGEVDPCASREEIEERDEAAEAAEQLLRAWDDIDPFDEGRTAAQIETSLRNPTLREGTLSAFADAMDALVGTVGGKTPTAGQIGCALRRIKGRWFAGARLVQTPPHRGTKRWVREARRHNPPGPGGGGARGVHGVHGCTSESDHVHHPNPNNDKGLRGRGVHGVHGSRQREETVKTGALDTCSDTFKGAAGEHVHHVHPDAVTHETSTSEGGVHDAHPMYTMYTTTSTAESIALDLGEWFSWCRRCPLPSDAVDDIMGSLPEPLEREALVRLLREAGIPLAEPDADNATAAPERRDPERAPSNTTSETTVPTVVLNHLAARLQRAHKREGTPDVLRLTLPELRAGPSFGDPKRQALDAVPADLLAAAAQSVAERLHINLVVEGAAL